MAWAERAFTSTEVDAAGRTLLGDEPDTTRALRVINNWRSSHAFPLNTLQVGLRNKARQVTRRSIVAQRIKRLSSIRGKLRRYDWLTLSQMQDVGGCRAVVQTVGQVQALEHLHMTSRMKHRLDYENDYITSPKSSGYRGIHLIYRYNSDKNEKYNGLRIEVQLRSRLQHAWATAVETVGTFLQQSLKSSQGEQEWLRFFALMGSYLAEREKSGGVPGTPDNPAELKLELQHYAELLDVAPKLRTYRATLTNVTAHSIPRAYYYVLVLEPSENRVTGTPYRQGQLEEASTHYSNVEREIIDLPGAEAVLVSVESLSALRRAYPNYFLDTDVFLEQVEEATS